MTIRYCLFLSIIFTVFACTTQQPITSTSSVPVSQEPKEEEKVWYLKVGLVDCEVMDTTVGNEEMAEMFMAMMGPSMEQEIVFNNYKSINLVKAENESGYSRGLLYDRNNKMAFQFLSTDSVDYYTEIDIEEELTKMTDTPEELAKIDSMFQIRKYPDSGVEILGFKCDEVTMSQPDDLSKVYTISYITDKIPSSAEAMGIMSKYIRGYQVKTIMFVNGLKLTIAPIELKETTDLEKYLDFNPEHYEKLTFEQLDEMKAN